MKIPKQIKFTAIGSITSLLLLMSPSCYAQQTPVAAPADLPAAIGMPNPMVAYDSLPKMNNDLGFAPLALPDTGYQCTKMYIIAKTTAELRYTSLDADDPSTFCVRSARQESFPSTRDISGIYGCTWWPYFISRTNLFFTETGSGAYAARWSNARYLFVLSASNTNGPDFQAELKRCISLTEQEYTN